MEVRELRIGNLVTVQAKDLDDNPAPMILELKHIDFMRILSGNNKALPIPLTEEWLIKLGFKKKGSHYYEIPNNQVLELEYIKTNLGEFYQIITKRLVEPRTAVGNKFKYVHQLQNLFFALTGTELEIK